ncbi:hypothetical protein GF325_05320 [Candidatus Bathyarchaeota archaeon]|nr:hypothetical protein [Candidatus Bathyarchaeota archaeon]
MLSDFTEKYRKLKEKDEASRDLGGSIDPVEERKQQEKMNFLFVKEIAKRIFDYDTRQELIRDFKSLSLPEKRDFLMREFGIDPDLAPNPKPGELREDLLTHDESKRDLKVPVCRKCGKPHNPFDPCFG